jgi:hypothetical protein
LLAAVVSLAGCFAEAPREIDYEAEALGGYPEERGEGIGVEADANEVFGIEDEAAGVSAVAWACSRDGSNRCVGTCPGAMVCAAIGTFTPRPGGPSYNRCACVAPSVRVLRNQGVN